MIKIKLNIANHSTIRKLRVKLKIHTSPKKTLPKAHKVTKKILMKFTKKSMYLMSLFKRFRMILVQWIIQDKIQVTRKLALLIIMSK